MNKLTIVGTGPAGLTAAIYTARAGLTPLVIEGMQPGGQLTTTTEIENFPGFPEGINGTELMDRMKQQAQRFGAVFVQNAVTGSELNPEKHVLRMMDGSAVDTMALIIATGATARYLPLDSVQQLIGHGVSGCATCDGAFYRNMPVAVVGGGDSAVEEATFLTRFASKVYIIHRRDELRASKIMAQRAISNDKIEIIWDSVIEDVLDVSKGVVTGLKLRNVKSGEISDLAVDGLFMGIGHTPNTDAFKGQLDLDEKGYIVARFTKTAVDGVFACGDVQDSVYRQAVSAAGSGCMAALEAERYLAEMGI
jgi:thioredoxin reductase (NADPH)